MKIYEAVFARVSFTKGLGEGVTINGNIQYQDRSPLENISDYSWRKMDGRTFTPNYPFEITNQNIPRHQSFVASVGINWQPGAKYIELPDRKMGIGSKYPTFGFNISQGINGVAGSDVNFTKWRFTVSDNLDLNLGGRLNYRLGASGFLNAEKVYLPDYNHFMGNRQAVASNYLSSFQLMSYYGFSNTDKLYATAHLEYHLNGLLTNKIPVFKKLNWFLVTGTNSLFINKNKYHAEVFVGIENILKVLRVDYVYGFQKNTRLNGIRFSMPFLVNGRRED